MKTLLMALVVALLVPATANAAPKRVIAIEWDTVENLHVLGMAPVGAADMKGYDTWVAAPRPRGMKDVGSRQSPSIERIAALKPAGPAPTMASLSLVMRVLSCLAKRRSTTSRERAASRLSWIDPRRPARSA